MGFTSISSERTLKIKPTQNIPLTFLYTFKLNKGD